MAKRGGYPGGMMPGNMNNLMKQAQRMQRQMEENQKAMETREFTATAGGNAISITMIAKATLVTAKRITVEDKFSFESEKIRSAMNFGPDICRFFNNFAKVKIKPK